MNLFELFVKIGVDDQASKKLSDISGKLGSGLKTAAKIGTAAVATAMAGITALTTAAVNSYAEYEQLVGGAQKIFNEMDYSKIQKDAQDAYKTMNISANEYLAIMNDVGATFAATMGDEKGYEAAKTGLRAISDYASGTGKNVDELSQKFTLITRSTSSYQSIADQFSGILPATSAAFLEQAQAAGILSDSYTSLTEVPIDEYQAAVSQMLERGVNELGLANNAMNESFSTLSGSLAMAKSAWSNLVTGLADDSADLDMLIGNFVESVGAVATNLIPKIGTALNGASKLVRDLIPAIVKEIPSIIKQNLPVLAEAAVSIVKSLANGISENQEILLTTALETVVFLADAILNLLPQIVALGLDLIVSLANGISKNLGTLIPTIIDVVLQIVDTLTSPAQLQNLLNAALLLVTELAYGLMDAIPALVDAALTIIENLVSFLTNPGNIGKLLLAAAEVVIAIGTGLVNSIPHLLEYWKNIPTSIIDNFKSTNWGQLGTDLVNGFRNGISRAWSSLSTWFKNLFGDLIGVAKKILGIASPSKVFKKIGGFTAEGFGIGFEDEFAHVKDDMEKSLKFDDASIGINASLKKMPAGQGSVYGNTRGVSIVQNIYSEAKTAADLMQEAIYQQEMAVYMGV